MSWAGYGSGLFSGAESGHELTIRNTVIGNNSGARDARGPDIFGRVRFQDYNLVENSNGYIAMGLTEHNIVGEDPRLDDLAENGGETETHAILSSSPALDNGSCTDVRGNPITVDQRGVHRPQGVQCDIGAYEFPQPALTLNKDVDDAIPEPGQRITYTIVVENVGAADVTGGAISDTLPSGLSLAGLVTVEPDAGTIGTLPTLVTGLTIPAGEQVTVTLPVTVSASLPIPTTITNTAAVTSIELPVPRTGLCTIAVASGFRPRVYLPMLVRIRQ